MEEIFGFLQRLIAGGMPELSLVDEDYGQLDTEEDTYPVTFPCALISAPEIQWKNTGPLSQQGQCTILVRLAIDCYDDTHYGSGTEDKVAERLGMAGKLHRLLQGAKPDGHGRLSREISRGYPLHGMIKVYESRYTMQVFDTI
jgi:hypothetical protein